MKLAIQKLVLFAGLLLWMPVSLAATDSSQTEVKKIAMMLDIVAKEYKEGVSDGKVINAMEYEESQLFLEQATERFQGIQSKNPHPDTNPVLMAQLAQLKSNIESKTDPKDVTDLIETVKTILLNNFSVTLAKEPTSPVSLEGGKSLYQTNCLQCHGASGEADGPLAKDMNPPPARLADPGITGDAETTAYDNFKIISVGIGGTAMKAWGETLSEQEIWNVAYYIRTFSNANLRLPQVNRLEPADITAAGASGHGANISEVRHLVNESLESMESGNAGQASRQAFDAYMIYERMEKQLINKDKELTLKLESDFGKYQARIRQGAPSAEIKSIHDSILEGLQRADDVLTKKVGFSGMFVQSLSIILREGFEAILIIAALITFLVKSGNREKVKSIYLGLITGIVLSFVTAYVLKEVLEINTASQEVLEGWIMLIAMVVLFWVSYWLITKIDYKKWQQYITQKVQEAVSTGNTFALAMVAFFAVYREGFETVLFYKALYTSAGDSTGGILPGFVVGCVVLGGVYYAVTQLGMRISIKWFFGVTSVFLYYMAFTFMGKGLHELQMGRQFPISSAPFLPEIPWLGMYPTWETFIGQLVLVLAYIFALWYTFGGKSGAPASEGVKPG